MRRNSRRRRKRQLREDLRETQAHYAHPKVVRDLLRAAAEDPRKGGIAEAEFRALDDVEFDLVDFHTRFERARVDGETANETQMAQRA